MHEQEIELDVGDVVQIGDHLLTVIDIDGDDVSFRVDIVTGSSRPLEPVAWPRK